MIQPYGPGQSVVDMLRGYQAFRDNRDESKWSAGGMEGNAPTLGAFLSQKEGGLRDAQAKNFNENTRGQGFANDVLGKLSGIQVKGLDLAERAFNNPNYNGPGYSVVLDDLFGGMAGQDLLNLRDYEETNITGKRLGQPDPGSGSGGGSIEGNATDSDPSNIKLPTSFTEDLISNIRNSQKNLWGGLLNGFLSLLSGGQETEQAPIRNKSSKITPPTVTGQGRDKKLGQSLDPSMIMPGRNMGDKNSNALPTTFLEDFWENIKKHYNR